MKLALHDSSAGSQAPSGEGEGEVSVEEGTEHPEAEAEQPLSLSDLLG